MGANIRKNIKIFLNFQNIHYLCNEFYRHNKPNRRKSGTNTMKQSFYILAATMILLMSCSDKQRKQHDRDTVDSLTLVLYDMMADQPQQALAFIDSMESEGIYSEGVANCRRAQLYSEQYQPRVSEVYAQRALKDEKLKKDNPRNYYLAWLLLIYSQQNMENTERALTYATQAIAEVQGDTSIAAQRYLPDYLESIAGCQFKLAHISEGNKSYEQAYELYEERLADAKTFSALYQPFMLAIDAINDNRLNNDLQSAMRWLPRLEKAYAKLVAAEDIPPHVKDESTAEKEIAQAALFAGARQTSEADAHYRAFLATDYAHTTVGRKTSSAYLEAAGKWKELLAANEASDSFYMENHSHHSMRYLINVLGEKFKTQMKLGYQESAQKTAERLINLLDTVNSQTQKEDAAELAVIYETQEKEQKIAEQQATLSHQQLIGLAIAMALLIVFFMVYTIHRRRAARRLAEVSAVKERIESELRIARDIQMSMVPSTFPDYEGLDLYASMMPAREVGGDLYGYVLVDDMLYFAIGDVSGKGVPASLFMAQATRLFRTFATQGEQPAEICTRINRALSEDNEQGMFVTMFIGLVDLKSGHLWFCNAGHNPPVIGGGDHHGDFLAMKANAPIGLWHELNYEGEEIDSIKGRPLFIYTDGLNEAENPARQQFGDNRLLDILRHTRFDSAKQVIDTLTTEVEKHRHGAEPNDDLTMMCLRVESIRI